METAVVTISPNTVLLSLDDYSAMVRIIGFEGFYSDGIFDYKDFNHQVTPESVGQFTGLKDKNGVDIYEGDWIHSAGYACEVVFIDGGFHTIYNHPEDGETLPIIDVNVELMRVIGNIHES